VTIQRTILCCTLAFFFPGAAWASLGACSGPYTLASNGLLAGGAGGTPVAGCEQVDLNFSNFNYGVITGGPTPDFLPIAFSGTTAPGTIATTVGASGGTWSWIGGITETAQINTVGVDSTASNGSTITQAVLSTGNATLGARASTSSYVLVMEEFCVGSSSFNCTSSSANYGIIEYVLNGNSSANSITYSQSCYGGGAVCQQLAANQSSAGVATVPLTDLNTGTAGLTLDIPSTTTLTVENIVEISDADDASFPFASLDTYSNEWVETTPEPSTLTLMGIALASLGLLASKRRVRGPATTL
jgi:hypothetical protein